MIIVGAGAAGKETLGIYLSTGKTDVVLYDDNQLVDDFVFEKYPIIKDENVLREIISKTPEFCVAVGHPRRRELLFNRILSFGGVPTNICSPNVSSLSEFNNAANIIQPGVYVSFDLKIGKSCMIHSNTNIGHKVRIGSFVNVSPGCSIVGPCEISDYAYIAVRSVILPNCKIGRNAIIPAGSVVSRDVKDFETFE